MCMNKLKKLWFLRCRRSREEKRYLIFPSFCGGGEKKRNPKNGGRREEEAWKRDKWSWGWNPKDSHKYFSKLRGSFDFLLQVQ